MRLTSGFWVAAFIRRCYAADAAAVVMRRGAEEAGAIFVIVDWLDDGGSDLYAPAPQTEFSEAAPTDRLFERVLERQGGDAIRAVIEREIRFDPDVWVVAVEDRQGRCFLDLV